MPLPRSPVGSAKGRGPVSPGRSHPDRRWLRAVVFATALLAFATACGVYTLGGPGHGTRFVLPPGALRSADPVVQAWSAYSLAKSACQLEHDGERPSHHDSFSCELRPRKVLVRRWAALASQGDDPSEEPTRDAYLDRLVRVERAGFLAEYVWVYLGARDWTPPEGLQLDAFDRWRSGHLGRHRPQTRLIGWWSEE